MILQMFDIIKNLVSYLDIQFIQKFFHWLIPRISCEKNYFKHKNNSSA